MTKRLTDGKYTYSKPTRPCLCGHSLGEHAAERVVDDGVPYQHCMADDETCECECFKPKK